MKKTSLVAVVVAISCATGYAGSTGGGEVRYYTSGTQTRVHGTFADTRASADTMQFIGCSVHSWSVFDYSMVLCRARDAAGTYLYCYTTHEQIARTARGISSSAHVMFMVDSTAPTTCRELQVENSSLYGPMQP
jgi:hypothetical protein